MGKKRRGPTLEELLARPWCYYCERDFDDLKILTLHQKAKHFKCDRCVRKLNTAGGLSVHMSQVHKEQLTEIDNALPNRSGLDVEIFGMEGIPEDVLQAHQQRVVAQFHQAEAERQAVTGNPPAGSAASGQPHKKPKLEDVSDLKARLAAHRAKRAEVAAGGSSGEATPLGAGQSASTPTSYGQTPGSASPAQQQQPPQLTYPAPYGGAPVPVAAPYPQQTASPVYPAYSPPGAAPYAPSPAGAAMYAPTGYSPQPYPGQPAAPGYGTPPPPFPQQQSPPTDTSLPPRPGSLPPLAGLPQRPAFAAPPLNAQQMQQMHMGHPAPPTPASGYTNGGATQTPEHVSSSVDDLISSAAKEAAVPEKPAKKDKTKNTRMIYSDENTSPEEKMAKLPRYTFSRPVFQQVTALGEIPGSIVVGTIRDQDKVVDPAH